MALKGIHIIPYQRLEKWLGKINYKSAILDNIAFKYVELFFERRPMSSPWALLLAIRNLFYFSHSHFRHGSSLTATAVIESHLAPHSQQPPQPHGKPEPQLWRDSVGPKNFPATERDSVYKGMVVNSTNVNISTIYVVSSATEFIGAFYLMVLPSTHGSREEMDHLIKN